MRQKNPSLNIVLGAVISLALLIWVFLKIDLHHALAEILSASPGWLACFWGVKLISIAIKSVRWRLVLRHALGRWPHRAGPALVIGYFGNSIFPAKLGELLRIQVLRRNNRARFSPVLGTIVLERSVDGIVVLGFLALATLFVPLPDWAKRATLLACLLFVSLFVMVVWLAYRQRPDHEHSKAEGMLGRFKNMVNRFSIGFRAARSPMVLTGAILLTITAWSMDVTGTYFIFRAFSLTLPWSSALVLVAITALGGSVPSAPSGLGTHQFLCITVLGWFGVSPERAVAVSVGEVSVMVLTVSIMGTFFLWQEGLSLRSLRQTSQNSALDAASGHDSDDPPETR